MASNIRYDHSYTCIPTFNAPDFPNQHRLVTINSIKQPRTRKETINILVATIPERRKLLVWKNVKKYEKDMIVVGNKIAALETEIANFVVRCAYGHRFD